MIKQQSTLGFLVTFNYLCYVRYILKMGVIIVIGLVANAILAILGIRDFSK